MYIMKFSVEILPIIASLLISTCNNDCYASNEIILRNNYIDHVATSIYRISNCTLLSNITNEEKQRYSILNTWLHYNQVVPNTTTIGELFGLMRVCINDARNVINDYLDLQNNNINILRNRSIANTLGWILEELNKPLNNDYFGNLFNNCIVFMSIFVSALKHNNIFYLNYAENKLNNISTLANNYLNIKISDIIQDNNNNNIYNNSINCKLPN